MINTELNLIISDFSYSPELSLFNESKEIEYDRARIKIDIKAYVISYVDFTLAPYVVRWPFRILYCITSYFHPPRDRHHRCTRVDWLCQGLVDCNAGLQIH